MDHVLSQKSKLYISIWWYKQNPLSKLSDIQNPTAQAQTVPYLAPIKAALDEVKQLGTTTVELP